MYHQLWTLRNILNVDNSVSPSIYAVIPYFIATDECAPVAPIWTSVILAYPPGKMLTSWLPEQPAAFLNPADLGCPPEYNYLLTQPGNDGEVQTSTGTEGRLTIDNQITTSGGLENLRTYIAEYTPSLLVNLQSYMSQFPPQWKHCSADNQNSAYPFGRDPPRVIQAMTALAGPVTDEGPYPTADPSTAQAQSVLPSPMPTVTPGPSRPEKPVGAISKVDDAPQNSAVAQDNSASQPGAAPQDPSSPSAPAQQDQDDPSDPTESGFGAPKSAFDSSNPAALSEVTQNQVVGSSDPIEVMHASAASDSASPPIDQFGWEPGIGTAHFSQSSDSLPDAPAFAQFNPEALETLDVAAASITDNPNSGDIQLNNTPQKHSAAPTAVGAIVDAAINGLISSSTPTSPLDVLGNTVAPNSAATIFSYSRPFSLQSPQNTMSGNPPSISTISKDLQAAGSGSQMFTSLPSLRVDSGSALTSVTVDNRSTMSLPPTGVTSIDAGSESSQTVTGGKAKSSSTSRASTAKHAWTMMWSIWITIIFASILLK